MTARDARIRSTAAGSSSTDVPPEPPRPRRRSSGRACQAQAVGRSSPWPAPLHVPRDPSRPHRCEAREPIRPERKPILRTCDACRTPRAASSWTPTAEHRLGGAVPSPAAAFLLALITLPTLFWLVTLKRTTVYTGPEEWLMTEVVPPSANGSSRRSAAARFADAGRSVRWAPAGSWRSASRSLGLIALAKGRRDLALLLAAGTLAFPIEWALKYFTSAHHACRSLIGGDLQRQQHRPG